MLKLRLTEESAILSRKLLILTVITGIILMVSTYAWFVGIRTLSLSNFSIQIAATENLLVSLDGESWSEETKFNQEDIEKISYDEHTNNWPKLIPMSTIGEIDSNVSRLKMYEQTSVKSVPGGFRIVSSRVDNYNSGQKEQDGYVVFDMFFKNASSAQYIKELNILDEENIFLTFDSGAKVSSDGLGGTGVENTVRVAFVQIGRVIATTTDRKVIQSIKCINDEDSEVTGICRTQIWEPNDAKHEVAAINWYNGTCRKRFGWNVDAESSYGGSCRPVVNGITYPTYAIRRAIKSSDNVNVYDGPVYNSYNNSALYEYPYFTDTMKLLESEDRQVFMTLEPNSITKIRLYIYLEGQDIDNYDNAQMGKKISIRFGFTKDRYVTTDGGSGTGNEETPEEPNEPGENENPGETTEP